MSWNVFWCFVVNMSVEHLSLIRFLSFRMKLIFDFLDMANWWGTNNGFLAGSHTFYRELRVNGPLQCGCIGQH